MSKGTNKPVIVVSKAQELVQFFNACRGRLVFYRLHFLLIHLQFARAHYISKILYLRLAKLNFF